MKLENSYKFVKDNIKHHEKEKVRKMTLRKKISQNIKKKHVFLEEQKMLNLKYKDPKQF